jgi:hypothetical protein
MLCGKECYLKYDMLPIFEQLNQNMNFNLQLSGLPRTGSGTSENIFSGPPQQGQTG